jgi:UDP-N-acetylmuramoylalanine--D-glutamate ligase
MEEYAADKGVIFSRLSPDGHALIASQDEYCKGYRPPEEQTIRISEDSAGHSESRPDSSESVLLREHAILPDSLLVGGAHMRKNLFTAGVAAFLMGMTEQEIRSAAATYRGIPHRLEPVAEIDGVLFVNDSAATIQEASRAAVQSFNRPVHLICGGSEKGLPLDLFKQISKEAATVTLLTGSATSQIEKHLRAARTTYAGPFGSLPEAVDHTRASARAGDVVLLSPGCASFGMFQNEFDRGDQFRTIVRSYEQ